MAFHEILNNKLTNTIVVIYYYMILAIFHMVLLLLSLTGYVVKSRKWLVV